MLFFVCLLSSRIGQHYRMVSNTVGIMHLGDVGTKEKDAVVCSSSSADPSAAFRGHPRSVEYMKYYWRTDMNADLIEAQELEEASVLQERVGKDHSLQPIFQLPASHHPMLCDVDAGESLSVWVYSGIAVYVTEAAVSRSAGKHAQYHYTLYYIVSYTSPSDQPPNLLLRL